MLANPQIFLLWNLTWSTGSVLIFSIKSKGINLISSNSFSDNELIIFNAEEGNFGLSLGNKLLVLEDRDRGGLMALMKMVRESGTGVSNKLWQEFPREPF